MAGSAAFRQTLSLRGLIQLFFSGMAMGLCDLVPGISGSNVAYLLGLYEELIEAVSAFSFREPKYVRFLGMIASGAVCSALLFVNFINYVLFHPVYSCWLMTFFAGLTAACAANALLIPKRGHVWMLAGAVCSLVLAQPLSFSLSSTGATLWLIPCGFLAGSAALMPAISGSMVLCLLGIYPTLIKELTHFTRSFSLDSLYFLVLLSIGALAGFIVSSRIIRTLMGRFADQMNHFFGGFIALSLPRLWPFKELLYREHVFWIGLICFGGGVVIAGTLAYWAHRQKSGLVAK